MSVLDRKLRRELLASSLLLTAIAGIIAVGVACLVTMGTAYRNLGEAKTRYYAQCRMADFSIELKKAPLADLEALAALPGVAEIRPRIQSYATLSVEDRIRPVNVQALSLPDTRQPVINDIVLRQGGYFTDRRRNETIVNDAFARHHGIRPGDWIRVILNNRREELFVVGTAISSEFIYLIGPGAIFPDPDQFGVLYVKQSYAEDVMDFEGATNQVLGLLAPGAQVRLGALLIDAERLLAPYGVFSTTPRADQPSHFFVSQEIDQLAAFALFLPMIFLAVAAMVLNVLLVRMVEQQRVVVGTLKALGYLDREVFTHFLKFGFSVGMVGGLAGSLLGQLLAEGLTEIYRWYFEFPELVNRFYPSVHMAGMAISLACALVGSIRGTKAVLRLKPAQAMRPKAPPRGGGVWLERFTWLWQRLSSRWRMVVRSLFRARLRTTAGVFAATMGAAILFTGLMFVDCTYYFVEFQFQWINRSDVDLTLSDFRGREALDEAAGLPGVDRAEPLLNVACTFRNGHRERKGAVTGLAPGALLTVPRDDRARPIRLPATGLAMDRALADILEISAGEEVVLEPVRGDRRPRTVPVTAIVDSFVGTSVYADIDYLSRLVDEEYALDGLQLALDGDPRNEAALFRALAEMPALEAVHARDEMIRAVEETLVQNINGFLGFIVGFAGVILFGSILNSSLISLAERQRELATLRVLGYGPWQVGGLLLRESLLVTLLGTVLGLPVGYGLTWLTAWFVSTEMFRFPVVLSVEAVAGTFVAALAFALATHLIVQRSVHKLDWLEAMKANE